jgi:AcrR family transcriptional regulator
MLRKVDKNEKKRAIALAAIPLLAEFGLAKTSVESIALAANVAKGTVYLYFKTKEEIILEIWNYVNELLYKNREKRYKTCKSAYEKLVVYFDYSILEESHSINSLLKILAMNMAIILNLSHSGLVKNYKIERFKELEDLEKIIKDGVRCEEFKEVDTLLVATLFANMFKGTLVNAICLCKNIEQIRKEVHAQKNLLIATLKKE